MLSQIKMVGNRIVRGLAACCPPSNSSAWYSVFSFASARNDTPFIGREDVQSAADFEGLVVIAEEEDCFSVRPRNRERQDALTCANRIISVA